MKSNLMKKLIISALLMLPMLLSAQSLERITENGNSGWRLSTANPENYGPIGKEALDLSSSIFSNDTIGATGDYSTAMGKGTTASGGGSTAMGGGTTASGIGSTAMGTGTTASDVGSTAMGGFTTASGLASTSMGHKTTASGLSSTSIGNKTTASGDWSTAMGDSTVASGDWSTSIGFETTASGLSSTSMGDKTTASGVVSTAIGNRTTASGEVSTAMGGYTTASGLYSTAMGISTTASGDASTAMGYHTAASGGGSTAMGVGTTASDRASLTIGEFNFVNSVVTSNGSDTVFRPTNAAFVIGNGTEDVRSDAFVVYFNGNATLAGELSVNSDARLKDNIQPLGSTLDKLHQIEGKTYTFLKDEEHTPKIGVLAQEVQSVFPELVSEGVDGTLSVNYQGLVPVLINAINEQEAKMSEQDAKIAALEAQNEEIKEMLRALTLQQSFAVKN